MRKTIVLLKLTKIKYFKTSNAIISHRTVSELARSLLLFQQFAREGIPSDEPLISSAFARNRGEVERGGRPTYFLLFPRGLPTFLRSDPPSDPNKPGSAAWGAGGLASGPSVCLSRLREREAARTGVFVGRRAGRVGRLPR